MENKAYIVQRVLARVIDAIIISFISLIFSFALTPFVNSEAIKKIDAQSNEIVSQYMNQEIDFRTYIHQTSDVSYELLKINGFSEIISIAIMILYFVVFQIYNKGQTIGRKIMKTEIVKIDGSELSMNDLIVREIFNYALLANTLTLVVALFGQNTFFYSNMVISALQMLFMLATIVMIFVRKDGRGLPDMIAKTEVINIG